VAPYGLQLGGRFALLGFGGHALFSGIFGGFLGYALVEPRWVLKISAPIVGLLLAIGAHMLNNALPLLVTLAGAAAGVDRYEPEPMPDVGFFEAMIGSSIREAVIFLPFVMVAALVLWRSDVWERRVIREELSGEVGGAVSAGEYEHIVADPGMRTIRLEQLPKHIAPELVDLQNQLAFRKRRLKNEGLDTANDPVAVALRERIDRLRAGT
jgi:hypothetical protein